MPSYFGSGLAEGISPYAKELFKSKLQEGREQRKPSAQLQSSLLDAVRSMTQAPTTADLQAQSDAAEANATPGSRLDMNQIVKSLAGGASPEMVQTPQPQRILQALKEMGISSLGGDSIGMNRSGGLVDPIYFDPNTNTYKDTSGNVVTDPIQRGTPVRTGRPTPDRLREEGAARGAGSAEGQLEVKGLDVGQSNAITANRAVIRSVDNLISLYDSDPNLFERSSTPGARALMLGDEGVKEIELWRNNLLNYKAFSEGGKQLTNTELSRTISTMTSLIRGEPVSRKAILEMKQKAEEGLSLLEGEYAKRKLGGQQDMSSMSDDDLLAIANGG